MSTSFSIIMPVYNDAEYLERAILSILNQEYYNLEIIIINDGSTDKTSEICNKFQNIDSRVKYFEQENRGPGAARNKGLGMARGEYIYFMDADDYLEPNMFVELCEILKDKNLDVIQFGYRLVNTQEKCLSIKNSEKKYIKNNVFLSSKLYAEGKELDMFLWSKVFKKEILKEFHFDDLYYAEDQLFLTRLFYRECKIMIIPNIYYNYVQSPFSLVRSSFRKEQLDGLVAMRKIYEIHDDNDLGLTAYSSEKICFYIAKFYFSMYKENINGIRKNNKELKKEYKYHYKNYKKQSNKINQGEGRKIFLFLFNYFPLSISALYNFRDQIRKRKNNSGG